MQPNHLALLACAAIELGFDKLPPQAKADYAKAKSLHGKVFKLQLRQLPFPLHLILAKQIQVLSQYQGEVQVELRADLATLYQLSEGASLTELIKQDKLQIEGDTQLLQDFSQFLKQIRFDFAEPLSRYLGDAPAHQILTKAKSLHLSTKQILNDTASHLSQLATEEYGLTPHQSEYRAYQAHLNDIERQTQQLEQKIAQLRDKITP
ncbi:SCP2 domain-containing protein [Shewanella sp. SR44-3]|uniref:ubiquinone biosynthesis accessory factor UbiJ n=1 Tax=unclassified Shewanella TaxID=196818 RepID=UPI0015F895D0|nr:SCP2 sterol-binding domain-containing protein [Shewanella sp. SR44-3]MBB1269991.1 SCP2 sterol-binding domain-containing protein [Shewanella sp. SR44-3]